jgi:hypothetical protein
MGAGKDLTCLHSLGGVSPPLHLTRLSGRLCVSIGPSVCLSVLEKESLISSCFSPGGANRLP